LQNYIVFDGLHCSGQYSSNGPDGSQDNSIHLLLRVNMRKWLILMENKKIKGTLLKPELKIKSLGMHDFMLKWPWDQNLWF